MEDDTLKAISVFLIGLIIITYTVAFVVVDPFQQSNSETEDTPRGMVSVTGDVPDNSTGTVTLRVVEISPQETIYCSSPNQNVTYDTRSKKVVNNTSESVFATKNGEIMIISNVTIGTKINCYSIFTGGDIPNHLKKEPKLIGSHIAGNVTLF